MWRWGNVSSQSAESDKLGSSVIQRERREGRLTLQIDEVESHQPEGQTGKDTSEQHQHARQAELPPERCFVAVPSSRSRRKRGIRGAEIPESIVSSFFLSCLPAAFEDLPDEPGGVSGSLCPAIAVPSSPKPFEVIKAAAAAAVGAA